MTDSDDPATTAPCPCGRTAHWDLKRERFVCPHCGTRFRAYHESHPCPFAKCLFYTGDSAEMMRHLEEEHGANRT